MTGSDGKAPHRRRDDGLIRRIWRDAAPLFALAVATYAVFHVENKVDAQVQGRRAAIAVLCGFGNGVEEAGRAALSADVQPVKFRKALERLGLPATAVRRKGQKLAGEAYARALSKAVVEQAGADARKVIKRDGSLDCARLQSVAKTIPTQ